MKEMRNSCECLVGKAKKGRYHWEELGIDGRITLKWILDISDGRVWTQFMLLGIEASGGLV
jgi:hypothetical protein